MRYNGVTVFKLIQNTPRWQKGNTDRCQPIRYIILISLMEWICFKVVRLRVLCRILLLTHCPSNYSTVAYIDNWDMGQLLSPENTFFMVEHEKLDQSRLLCTSWPKPENLIKCDFPIFYFTWHSLSFMVLKKYIYEWTLTKDVYTLNTAWFTVCLLQINFSPLLYLLNFMQSLLALLF